MDIVTISQFVLPVRMGCTPEERAIVQSIQIDLVLETDFADLLKSGDLTKDGVDYAVVRREIKEVAHANEFPLLEQFGDAILRKIFFNKRILVAKLSVKKLERWKDAVPGVVIYRENA
jgi:FolB domain-containing protein